MLLTEFHRFLKREDKERLLQQRGSVIRLYGLSGSGKSTIANAVERQLHEQGRFTIILDGDNLRTGLNSNLGFTDDDRAENIRRIGEVAARDGADIVVNLQGDEPLLDPADADQPLPLRLQQQQPECPESEPQLNQASVPAINNMHISALEIEPPFLAKSSSVGHSGSNRGDQQQQHEYHNGQNDHPKKKKNDCR